MAKYIVKPNQNLFDISLMLYGSIEGLFDLLITNEGLSMTDDLQAGAELEYHDDFVINAGIVSNIKEAGLLSANGERHVYYKEPNEPLMWISAVDEDLPFSRLRASGEGHMVIDWGDNSELETIALNHELQTIVHYYDNVVDERRISVYGNCSFTKLVTTNLGGDVFPVRQIIVDEYINQANKTRLNGLFLFEGTYYVNLKNCSIDNLLPLGNMNLQELDLRLVAFRDQSVIDDYLEYIVNNYGTRRNCTVYLDTEPSERGMAAIDTIIHEPEWNASGKWKFIIKDNIYTAA